jgi:hypothetical protein
MSALKKLFPYWILFCLFSLSHQAFAFLSHKATGRACFTLRNIKIDPSCNASFNGFDQDYEAFGANFFIGDNYHYFYKNRDLFDDKNKKTLISEILSEKEPIGVSSQMNLWWRQTSFTAGIQPLNLFYQSEVLNSAYPRVYVDAGFSQKAFFQYGKKFDNKTLFGFQFQIIDQQIVHEDLYLFEALPQLDDYFTTERQNLFLIEPSFSWDLSDNNNSWNPLLTAQISNLGFASKKIESRPLKTQFNLGASIAPQVFDQNWETSIAYNIDTEKDFLDNWSLGTAFYVRWLQIYGGLEKNAASAGLSTRFRNWTSGIMLHRSRNVLDKNFRDAIYLDFRILI